MIGISSQNVLVITTLVVLFCISSIIPSFAITLESYDSTYEPAARIFLKGTIEPENDFYKPVILNVFNSEGGKIIQMQSHIVENTFTSLITGPKGSFEPGIYTIEASHSSLNSTASIIITIIESENS